MEAGKREGRYLRRRSGTPGRWVRVTVLVLWDGALLYMIVKCLIEPAWGAAFVALVSVNLGYEL